MKFTQARQLTTNYRANRLARQLAPAAAVARSLTVAAKTTAADYLTTVQGLTGGVLRSVQTTFGKRVKALAAALGLAAATVPDVIVSGGKRREIQVAAYASDTAASLFGQVWAEYYAS